MRGNLTETPRCRVHPCEGLANSTGAGTYTTTQRRARTVSARGLSFTTELHGFEVQRNRMVRRTAVPISRPLSTHSATDFIVEVHRRGTWERVFTSGVLKLGDKPRNVSADITGADRLRLITTDAGDGIACDHAEWAEAKVF